MNCIASQHPTVLFAIATHCYSVQNCWNGRPSEQLTAIRHVKVAEVLSTRYVQRRLLAAGQLAAEQTGLGVAGRHSIWTPTSKQTAIAALHVCRQTRRQQNTLKECIDRIGQQNIENRQNVLYKTEQSVVTRH